MNDKEFCEKVRELVRYVSPEFYQEAAQLGEEIIYAYVARGDWLNVEDAEIEEKENGNDCLGS